MTSTGLAIAAAVAVLAVVVAVVVVILRRRSSSAGPENKPAGWYADPADTSMVRWWDGQAWTTHIQDKPSAP